MRRLLTKKIKDGKQNWAKSKDFPHKKTAGSETGSSVLLTKKNILIMTVRTTINIQKLLN